MHLLPALYGTEDYLCPTSSRNIDICQQHCIFRQPKPCDEDLYELCIIIMAENTLAWPVDAYEAIDLYVELQTFVKPHIG